jgi:hypothetical protein
VDEQTDDAIPDFILALETKPDFTELTRKLRSFVLPDEGVTPPGPMKNRARR